ncbi:MAG: hypothetical protein KJ970_00070 [Candidatus Eisenbacteria bacterium]|uniref:Uncharacterized protein n=1 Tax=Eiseniibacteriota bacterium TaxID=2212470 RepID=A0A948RSP4_UNCEI|nr:hypothetical protein [Candidatus Eisenbacteria bacterium]MBU1947831.1 hypothetical protein [Candidatus Eisenbacteria bacterium]MBU2689296.1 hypothetical protein [Candidatus Eisenbacteria bacterium]
MDAFYGQLANVSAILAGFSITFLALLLGHKEKGRILSASIAVTTAAAACLLVSALGWSLMGSFAAQTLVKGGPEALQESAETWRLGAHISLSRSFILGLFFLFSMLGLSGWLKNRYLGVFSILCTVFAAVGVWNVLRYMIN